MTVQVNQYPVTVSAIGLKVALNSEVLPPANLFVAVVPAGTAG